ncbi:MAG: glycine cleavage system protein GcvH [Planctomycetota bacterium]|jgi:glycine cleavage system H protein
MPVPEELKYTKSHEWVKIEGEVAVTGITEFAVKALSDLVYVDMPEIEDLTERGHPYAEIESVKAVADVNAPLSGEVAEINETLVENLDDLSNDPFGKGWIAKIKISYPEELKDLMSAEDYEVHLKQEAKKH